MNTNILIATGGTGGHIFPALALKKYLKEKNFNVKVTLDKKFTQYGKFDNNHLLVKSAHFSNKNPFLIIKSLLIITYGFFQALVILASFKPKLVIGFGGYATFPVLLAAAIMNKTIVLHEANTVIGKVNRLFLNRAKYLTLGFNKILGIKDIDSNKIIFTGNPIRDNINAHSKTRSKESRFCIFIIGGSQGAKTFSKIIPDVIFSLDKDVKQKLTVIQQVKQEDIDLIKERYQKEGINCQISHFFTDIDLKFKEADLVIARSGASTISEIIKTKVPAIFIPYPYAADNHQFYNAKELVDNKTAWLVSESNQANQKLLQILEEIFKNPEILKDYSQNLTKLESNPCENIYNLILKITYDREFK